MRADCSRTSQVRVNKREMIKPRRTADYGIANQRIDTSTIHTAGGVPLCHLRGWATRRNSPSIVQISNRGAEPTKLLKDAPARDKLPFGGVSSPTPECHPGEGYPDPASFEDRASRNLGDQPPSSPVRVDSSHIKADKPRDRNHPRSPFEQAVPSYSLLRVARRFVLTNLPRVPSAGPCSRSTLHRRWWYRGPTEDPLRVPLETTVKNLYL